jgi:hypothetical protein
VQGRRRALPKGISVGWDVGATRPTGSPVPGETLLAVRGPQNLPGLASRRPGAVQGDDTVRLSAEDLDLVEKPEAHKPLREFIDVPSGSLATRSDGDHEDLYLGLAYPVDDAESLASGPHAAEALEFSEKRLALEVGVEGEPVDPFPDFLQGAAICDRRQHVAGRGGQADAIWAWHHRSSSRFTFSHGMVFPLRASLTLRRSARMVSSSPRISRVSTRLS